MMFLLCYTHVRRDSSEQLSTTANGVDPFPCPLDTLDASITKVELASLCLMTKIGS